MRKHLPRHLLGALLLALLLGHSAHIYRIPLIDTLDALCYDTKVRLTMPRGVDQRVVIVAIDEKSLAEQGRWPWGRDKLAKLVQTLFDRYRIRQMGFDVVFAEPDASSGIESLERLASNELRDVPGFQASLRKLRPQLDFDARFAAAIQNRPVLLGYYFSSRTGGESSGALPPPVFPAGTFDGRAIAFSHWNSYGGNLPLLQRAAAGGGHFNPLVDDDGVTRGVPLLAEYRGQYYEALALAMVRELLGKPDILPGYPQGAPADAGMEWLELALKDGSRITIPVDEHVAALVPFRGYQGSFPYVSATDVLEGRVPRERLANRIVLVGATAPGLMDLRVTPVGAAYPGVEIHANLIAGLLDGTLKHKPGYILGADAVLVLLAGLLMIFLLPALSPFRATVLGLIMFSGLLGINLFFWYGENVVLPLANGLIAVALLYAMNMSWGYFVETRVKRQLTGLFGQYVPPELVEEMSRDPENYSMAGRKAELTVLFSDVRGFTTISEGLEPDDLSALMNQYLGAMTVIVRKHRGTLDKYIGDAIMAFWGAPVDDAAHARHGVLTALEMQAEMAGLNARLAARGWPELKIGIGLNTGEMTVGDMGSPIRQSYTVMGDAVNLGSRLEGITKQYGVGIIVGESTRQQAGPEFIFRELDRVRVKGKDAPVGIYEPLGLASEVSRAELDELTLWEQALRAYRGQDWNLAEDLLQRLSAARSRYLYDLYAERIRHLRQEPPPKDWDGVTTFETK